jgi:hypothetical protein
LLFCIRVLLGDWFALLISSLINHRFFFRGVIFQIYIEGIYWIGVLFINIFFKWWLFYSFILNKWTLSFHILIYLLCLRNILFFEWHRLIFFLFIKRVARIISGHIGQLFLGILLILFVLTKGKRKLNEIIEIFIWFIVNNCLMALHYWSKRQLWRFRKFLDRFFSALLNFLPPFVNDSLEMVCAIEHFFQARIARIVSRSANADIKVEKIHFSIKLYTSILIALSSNWWMSIVEWAKLFEIQFQNLLRLEIFSWFLLRI